jgi:hypothetical protein
MLQDKLISVQSKLNAPKNQHNKFGGYNYRSAEDILEAVKPLLKEVNACITITDDIVSVGNRIYVKATATFIDGDQSVSINAFAREEETKKGMDASQITGSASSYARKYALNGLLLIDDNKDADATNTHGKETSVITPKNPPTPKADTKPTLTLDDRRKGVLKAYEGKLNDLESLLIKIEALENPFMNSKSEIESVVMNLTNEQIDNLKKARKAN